MLDPHLWLLLAGLCLLGAMTPGASLAVVTHHTLCGSWRAGVSAGLAHALGIAVYAVLTVIGIATVLYRFPGLALAIRILGSLLLVWLALRSWRAAAAPQASQVAPTSRRRAARDGFLIAFLNPKVALFFLALFSQFIDPHMARVARIQVATTAVVIDGSWYSLVALALARGPVLAALRRKQSWLARLTAMVLLLAAVVMWI